MKEQLSSEMKIFREVRKPENLGLYLQGVLSCIESAFDGKVTKEDALDHVTGDFVIVALNDEKVVGFSSSVYSSPKESVNIPNEEQGVYFQGSAVSKEAQGLGVYKRMNHLRINDALFQNKSLIFTRTQNPRVEAGIESQLNSIIASGELGNYTRDRKLVQNVYGRMLTEQRPVANNHQFPELNYDEGDAYILLYYLMKNLTHEYEEAKRGKRFTWLE